MISSAADIARALGGHRSGDGFLVRCPVPSHGKGSGDRHPSLLIKDGHTRLLVRCFAGCDTAEIIDVMRRCGLASAAPATASSARRIPAPTVCVKRGARASEIWRSSLPIAGTLGDRYLKVFRRLSSPFPQSLRFAPDAAHPRHRMAMPALVAAVQAEGASLAAVQLTFLSEDGSKALLQEPRLTIGALRDGAVRLGAARETLGIAEGVEDALAASQLSQVPCWACVGAGRMHRVRVPDEVQELHIFADDDEAGLAAAERTAERHRDLGRRVVLRLPPKGLKDWGDVVVRQRARTAA